ncbi:MAG: trypsin-like peptidase domain-containing protein [Thiobacillus sp.]|nr:trypsin-like peptidase domain-containing protein [Thiobacillus sp.]
MPRGRTLLLSLFAMLRSMVASAGEPDWTTRVHQLVVTRTDGVTELGSAVPLAANRMVTNCHVLRDAAHIEVKLDGLTRQATADLHDAYRDLCFLTVPGQHTEAMPMIDVGETRVGLDVVAVGYPEGQFAVSPGRIVGLHHCECDGGKVIQTSARFERGASGGGLFDLQGRLVGILTFKAKAGGNFHFALPVGWLRHVAMEGLQPISGAKSFWENPGRESGYFLAACDLGAQKKWSALKPLAQEWVQLEPNNPESWMALGRAHRGLEQAEQAAEAFQHVLMLDSTHAEAKWALQQLEFDLGRSLAVPDSL